MTILCLGESCSSKHTYYSEFQDIDSYGWVAKEPITFTPNVDSISSSNLKLNIILRHDNFYKYRNLWLFIDYFDKSGNIERDTVECQLADVSGKWYSKGFGSTYEYSSSLQSRKNIKDIRKIIIWQGMREDTINNIGEIGLSITGSDD